MKLKSETGDVTSESKEVRSFQIDVARPPSTVRLSLSGVTGELDFDDWPLLLEQVTAHELVKRHTPDLLGPPLGEPSLRAVVGQIISTPTYQLFLAGIDIAERIELVSEASYPRVKRRFTVLNQWMPSVTGAGGLSFVPDDLLRHHEPSAIQDLVKNNKLCRAILRNGDGEGDMTRLYIPYATPIGFLVQPVSENAERLWDEVRSFYYATRQPA